MGAKRKVYTPEFKAQAVKMVTEQKLSVAEAACRLGVHESRPHEWKKAIGRDDTQPPSPARAARRPWRITAASRPRWSAWRWSATS